MPEQSGVSCPECESIDSSVINSRPLKGDKGLMVRRRRQCQCEHRFNTVEIPITYFKELTKSAAEILKPVVLHALITRGETPDGCKKLIQEYLDDYAQSDQ